MTAPLKSIEPASDVAGLMRDIGRRSTAAARVPALAFAALAKASARTFTVPLLVSVSTAFASPE